MVGFYVADLLNEEEFFQIPSSLGVWEFTRLVDYDQRKEKIDEGLYAATHVATCEASGDRLQTDEFADLCQEIRDICLILSFIGAKCVTALGNTHASIIKFITMPDWFLRPRGIVGFNPLGTSATVEELFRPGISHLQQRIEGRRMRLLLTHWISGLTCFTLEDVFLATCVEMDIVKQCEKSNPDEKLSYCPLRGMGEKPSPLGEDFSRVAVLCKTTARHLTPSTT